MAEIQPFVATRYNASLAPRLGDLVTPPYDVIDEALHDALHTRDEHNFVRIDLGRRAPDDTEFANRYTRAGQLWQDWKNQGVLAEDSRKAFYVYEQEFTIPTGERHRRRGFYAAVRLQDFSEGGIRAHEHTFEGPKADRFRLMRATHANLSPIFVIYDDPTRTIDEALAAGVDGQPPIECAFDGVTQRLWCVHDSRLIQLIQNAMADQTLFIADGHHRYETSLLYRDEMRAAMGRDDGNQPFDYTMMYLNNAHDEGLVVLPTHRMISKETCHGVEFDETMSDIAEFFDLEPLQLHAEGEALGAEARRLNDMLTRAGEQGTAFIMLRPRGRACLLRLKPDADLNELIDDDEMPPAVKRLDVSILHQFLINRALLGNPEIDLDDQDVKYVKDAGEVLELMNRQCCKFGVAFLLNATRVDQVTEVARLGLRMPHKSTYFYPKLVTGMVMRDMNSPW